MRNFIDKVFNWKTHPASVFYLVIPLVFIAVSLLFAQAYFQYKVNDDIGYLIILGIFAVLAAVAGFFMRRDWNKRVRPYKK